MSKDCDIKREIENIIMVIPLLIDSIMSNWKNLRQSFQQLISNPNMKAFLRSPVTQLVGINTAMFVPL
jgi:hypothetical protein